MTHNCTMDTVRRARQFASVAHRDQTYGKGSPFIVHPAAAARILSQWGYGYDVVAAAWLHDVVEDTPVTIEQIEAAFGEHVAALVDAVTIDDPDDPEPYAGIPLYPRSAIVKLADRMANLECCKRGDRFATKYLADADRFEAAIRAHVPPEIWTAYRLKLRKLQP